MEPLLQILITLFCLHSVGRAAEVMQKPKFHLAHPGNNVSFHCQHDDTAFQDKFWYYLRKGEALRRIGYTASNVDVFMEDEFKGRMKIQLISAQKNTLHISNVSEQDSAVYYCASSIPGYNSAQYFGGGTTLHVLGEKEEQIDPKVRIFSPNKQEFKEHGLISLVCVATGFFPQHVRLTWYLNGEKIESLYQSVPKIDNDKTYSTSSRLSLTESQYFNPDTKIRCEAAFVGSNSSASDETYGELGCGVSKESYGRYMNQGKISYIMVLFKSGLYAVIVLAVIRRRKALSGSC